MHSITTASAPLWAGVCQGEQLDAARPLKSSSPQRGDSPAGAVRLPAAQGLCREDAVPQPQRVPGEQGCLTGCA